MRIGFIVTLLSAVLVLTACSDDTPDLEYAEQQPVTPEEIIEEGPCGGLTLFDAFEAHREQVPAAPEEMEWHVVDDGAYDPCLPLSWIQLLSNPEDINSDSQVMLFHANRFIGTADGANATNVSVQRIDDYSIDITSQQVRGLITDTFIFNPDENSLEKHVGYTETETESAPATAVDTEERVYLRDGDSYSFRTPTGNIGCTISASRTECSVLSLSSTNGEDEPQNGLIIENGSASTTHVSSTPDWVSASSSQGSTLQYGETITYENIYCISSTDALICEDMTTGAGGSLSRDAVSVY